MSIQTRVIQRIDYASRFYARNDPPGNWVTGFDELEIRLGLAVLRSNIYIYIRFNILR